MYSIAEIKEKINDAIVKRLPNCEKSDINRQILKDREIGFEAILTGNGDEKILIPEDGAFQFLYRGQNEEFIPCLPTLYREKPNKLSPAERFLWRMRLVVFRHLVDSHPVVKRFFKRHGFRVDYEGLAQHYGLATSVLDLTSNIDIALFFATCRYDKKSQTYKPFDDGEVHEGILYVFCPVRGNEPSPCKISEYLSQSIQPIGLQPFIRPAVQKGYALHLKEGQSAKSWAYRFKFTNEDSKHFFDLFNQGADLWINDELVDKARQVIDMTTFSRTLFDETFDEYRPKGYSKTKLKKELFKIGIKLEKTIIPILFDDVEASRIINNWNSWQGKEIANTICQRTWFEHDGETENPDVTKSINHGPRQMFRNLRMIAEYEFLNFLVYPDGPEGAEWINYTGRPNETHKPFSKAEQQWTKVTAKMYDLFARTYLQESDWKI